MKVRARSGVVIKGGFMDFPLASECTAHGCIKESAMKKMEKMPFVRKIVRSFDNTVQSRAFVEATYKNRPVLIDRTTGTVYDGFLLRPFFSHQLQIIGDDHGNAGRKQSRISRNVQRFGGNLA